MKTARILVPLLTLAALCLGADACGDPEPAMCITESGMAYPSGSTNIPEGDGCNSCSCVDGELLCTDGPCPPSGPRACIATNGDTYPHGSVGVPAPDGCNTCSCDDGVLTGCTDMACVPGPTVCIVDGVTYPNGATVPAPDGCNTCFCDDGVLSGCTDAACVPPENACNVFGRSYEAGWAPSNDGCNTCSCEMGRVTGACTDLACAPIEILSCDDLPSYDSGPRGVRAIRVDGSGETLSVTVSYSGGCAPHYFRLCYDPNYTALDVDPARATLRLDHDDQDDECDGVGTEERTFDIGPLLDYHRSNFGDTAPLEIQLDTHVGTYTP